MNPTVPRYLDAGFANIGDVQFLPGCGVLLVDTPNVERLTDLPRRRWTEFLAALRLRATGDRRPPGAAVPGRMLVRPENVARPRARRSPS
ncbi:hypothetical protein ABZX92_31830 [Lentzea sp. NPDC006480]|uniref:hypothetical protein n=1 Tax=Lentzea sp. NPDC006480 TaxID=3157176 RepID=UPI0033B2CE8F